MVDKEKLPYQLQDYDECQLEGVDTVRKKLLDSPIGCIVADAGGSVKRLGEIFDFVVKPDGVLGDVLPSGASFETIFKDSNTRGLLRNLAGEMFDDVDMSAYYAPHIPLAVLSDSVSVQSEGDKLRFNPNGVVTVAEFLDFVNAVRYGSGCAGRGVKSPDGLLNGSEFFSAGYNACINGVGSPFYGLYSFRGLFESITRIEAAYILVVCRCIFGSVCGSTFDIGLSFNWECPNDVLQGYSDGFFYKVSCSHYRADESAVISVDIKDYIGSDSFFDFMKKVRTGFKPIPIPMFMSLVELDINGVIYTPFDDSCLNPLDELTRGEMCYMLSGIAKFVK